MLNLPVQLDVPPPRVLRLLSLLWLAGVALALVAQAGATWRVYLFRAEAEPVFASTGLVVGRQAYQDWTVNAASRPAEAAGVRPNSVIERVDGADVPRTETYQDVARRLAGPEGGAVRLRLRTGESARDVALVRSPENRAQAYAAGQRTFRIISQAVDLAVAILMIGGAMLLRLRRFKDPLAIIFSFAMLFFAMVGTWRFWSWLGVQPMSFVIDAIWLGLALFALPAFPSGRFVPAWSRWFLLAGPIAATVLALPEMPTAGAQAIRIVMIAAVIACVVIRFRRTPPGLERQQMKWAMLGVGAGMFCYGLGEGITYLTMLVAIPGLHAWFVIVGYVLSRVALLIMALGILVSLLDYRLNDADAAIGRSTGYALITTVVAVLWALTTTWLNKGITLIAGASNAALATTLSTIVALVVLTPAKTRVMGWTETRFQRGLMRLKSLPKRIARWQIEDDPNQVAAQALHAIVEGVNAVHAALISGEDEDEAPILALSNVQAEQVTEQLGARRPALRAHDRFPLRLPVRNDAGVIATLLLGRRSDNASYSRGERDAIRAITEPLADALRVSQRNAAFGDAIAELKARMQQLERSPTPPARDGGDLRLAT